jgi:hypothetical protein
LKYTLSLHYKNEMANYYNISTGGCQTANSRPVSPVSFACTQTDNTTMELGWDETDSDFTNYSVERGTAAAGPFTVVATGFPTAPLGAVTITDTGLTKNTRYYYRFRTWKRTKWSDYQTDNEITTNV